MDKSLIVYKRKSISDIPRPLTYVSKDIRIVGFCWCCFWVIEDLTFQVSFALFHYQDHSCGVRALEKGCAIKLYNVGMVQFSDQEIKKTRNIQKSNAKFPLFKLQDYVIFLSFLSHAPWYIDRLPHTSE